MKKIVLLLLIFCFFSQSKSMLEFATHSNEIFKTYQEFVYKQFDQPIDWKTIACVGIGVWFVVDKTFPLIKKGFNKLWGTPPPKTMQELTEESIDNNRKIIFEAISSFQKGTNQELENCRKEINDIDIRICNFFKDIENKVNDQLAIFFEKKGNTIDQSTQVFLDEKTKSINLQMVRAINVCKETLSKNISDEKIDALDRRLQKFEDVMVSYKEADSKLTWLSNRINKMKNIITFLEEKINTFPENPIFHSDVSTPKTTPRIEIRSESSEDLPHLQDSDSSSDEEFEYQDPQKHEKHKSLSHYSILTSIPSNVSNEPSIAEE